MPRRCAEKANHPAWARVELAAHGWAYPEASVVSVGALERDGWPGEAAWRPPVFRVVRHFAEAYLRLWKHILDDDPQPWNSETVVAARRWADHLGGTNERLGR